MHLVCSFLILLTLLIGTAMTCPTNCTCKWKGGKQTVECVNKSMLMVPGEIDSGTQVLDFSGNNLQTLGSEQFQKLGLVNLQKVFAARCHIASVDERTFRGLSNLVELDLSNNHLPRIPTEVFADLPSLMKLSLNGNPLKVIKAYYFKNLKYLISLELSHCQLESVESDAFYGLAALEMLKLDYNALKFIPGVNTIPRRLHGIYLQHNPWFCDCKLADLYSWLNLTSLPQVVEPSCDGPSRLKGAPIKQLDEQELACLPDVSPTSLYLEIPEGKNVSLLCKVNGTPEARVSWRFEDKVLQNDSTIAPGVHLYYYLVEGTVEKKSELFIFNTNIEDNGTFICVAENQAGRAQANYSIRIVVKEEFIPQSRKIPAEYLMGLCVAVAAVIVFLLTCFVSCWLRYRVKRKRRRKKEKNKELVLYSGNSVMQASPITRSGETLSTISDASMQKMNGNIFIADQSILKMTNAVEAEGAANLSASQSPSYPFSTFMTDQNPDLISDTGQDRKFTNNLEGIAVQMTDYDRRNQVPEEPSYASLPPCMEDTAWTTSSISMPIPVSNGIHTLPLNVCFSSNASVAADQIVLNTFPNNFGLPKVATHFPAILPATAFYRTLPHKRHNANSSTQRYARDAELMSRSTKPASYEHFHTVDIRYNVEGYPKDPPVYTYTPHVSFSDTVQILGKSPEPRIERCKGADNENKHDVPSEMKSKCAKLSISIKNMNDSPDEGYVGESADTTEV